MNPKDTTALCDPEGRGVERRFASITNIKLKQRAQEGLGGGGEQ
jgi:hypothetical protein